MERRGEIRLLHDEVHALGEGYQLAGYGYVPLTIFSVKDWEKLDTCHQKVSVDSYYAYVSTESGMRRIDTEEWLRGRTTIDEDLAELARKSDPSNTVYVMHAPPYGTNLDKLHYGTLAGSRAIRQFIMERQPFLMLHGHIHQSIRMSGSYLEKIGRTISVNPGQTIRSIRAVVFELPDVAATARLVSGDDLPKWDWAKSCDN